MTEPFKLSRPEPRGRAVFSTRLSPDDGEWVRRYAEQHGLTVGSVLRQFIEHMIAQEKKRAD